MLIPAGLSIALVSGIVSLLYGDPFMTGKWFTVFIPGLEQVDIGTPLVFDCGVYLLVLGVALTMILTLTEE
jgi:multicomponent Na+:H+ antiporter subunit B